MTATVGGQDVSRETYERLEEFSALVRKWTAKINLIAPVTVDQIWTRHIEDSAMIYGLVDHPASKWTDIGSGGGFPGIVIAILAKEDAPNTQFALIESDQRKATFLRTAIRNFDLNASVLSERIEAAPKQGADIVSARALASLSGMMPLLQRHLSETGFALLHKGRRYQQEIAQARQNWSFDLEEYPSFTDPDARLLKIKGISERE
jgi:16S rRNA (guanine527-N7)-methyltransferase